MQSPKTPNPRPYFQTPFHTITPQNYKQIIQKLLRYLLSLKRICWLKHLKNYLLLHTFMSVVDVVYELDAHYERIQVGDGFDDRDVEAVEEMFRNSPGFVWASTHKIYQIFSRDPMLKEEKYANIRPPNQLFQRINKNSQPIVREYDNIGRPIRRIPNKTQFEQDDVFLRDSLFRRKGKIQGLEQNDDIAKQSKKQDRADEQKQQKSQTRQKEPCSLKSNIGRFTEEKSALELKHKEQISLNENTEKKQKCFEGLLKIDEENN